MKRIGNKVSYIRKPLAKNSFVSAGLSAVSVILAAAAVGLSYMSQGNAPLTAAALGFSSILTAVSAIAYGVFSFFEKEKNYLLAKISLTASGVMVFIWLIIIALG